MRHLSCPRHMSDGGISNLLILRALDTPSLLTWTKTCEVDDIFIPILQSRKTGPQTIKVTCQGYTTRWQTQDLNPFCLAPESKPEHTALLSSRGSWAVLLEVFFIFVWRITSTLLMFQHPV